MKIKPEGLRSLPSDLHARPLRSLCEIQSLARPEGVHPNNFFFAKISAGRHGAADMRGLTTGALIFLTKVGGSSHWTATAFPHTTQICDISSDHPPKVSGACRGVGSNPGHATTDTDIR